MTTKTVTMTMINDFPFSISRDYGLPHTTVQVRKTLEYSFQQRPLTREKIRLLKRLEGEPLVLLVGAEEEEDRLHLRFEYVHRKLDNEFWSLGMEMVEGVREQLVRLGDILADHYVVHEFRFENVGLDRWNGVKYFLGVAFRIDRMVNKEEIRGRYRRVIEGWFSLGGRFYREKKKEGRNEKQWTESLGVVHWNRQTMNELRVGKKDDMGLKINKLKNYVKEVTACTPKSCTGMCNENNDQNRVFQANKTMTPNYAKAQNKIAEFRRGRLYRGSGNTGIYGKSSSGCQQPPQKIEIPLAYRLSKEGERTLESPSHAHELTVKHSAHRKSPSNVVQNEQVGGPKLRQISKELLNFSKGRLTDSWQKEYLRLGKSDKYCKQFMNFLEDEPTPSQLGSMSPFSSGSMSPLTTLISQIGVQSLELCHKDSQAASSSDLQHRVKNAIRNSMKLINGLKYRDSYRAKQ